MCHLATLTNTKKTIKQGVPAVAQGKNGEKMNYIRGWSGMIFLGSDFILWAQAFSGLKNLLNKSGFSWARALLHK
jgi:hypothetical protein